MVKLISFGTNLGKIPAAVPPNVTAITPGIMTDNQYKGIPTVEGLKNIVVVATICATVHQINTL